MSARASAAPAPASGAAEIAEAEAEASARLETELETAPRSETRPAEAGLARGVDAVLAGRLCLCAHLMTHVPARGAGLVEHQTGLFAAEGNEAEAAVL